MLADRNVYMHSVVRCSVVFCWQCTWQRWWVSADWSCWLSAEMAWSGHSREQGRFFSVNIQCQMLSDWCCHIL